MDKEELLFTNSHIIRTKQGSLKCVGMEKQMRGSFCTAVCDRKLRQCRCGQSALNTLLAIRTKARNGS